MPRWKGGPFFEGDTITLQGKFESDGQDQVPDDNTGKCSIFKKGVPTPVVNDEDAFLSGAKIFYIAHNLDTGEYICYLSATFNQGIDKRTGEIKFVVKAKSGIW
jgi:hypothetical protein